MDEKSSSEQVGRQYSFAGFVLDADRGALLKDGEEIRLRPKAFSLLEYLLRHPGTLRSKDDILGAVWPDTVVTDDAITQCLIDIRRALDDRSHRIISTIPRRGYRMEADVVTIDPAKSASSTEDDTTNPRRSHRQPLAVLVAVVLALVASLAWYAHRSSDPDGSAQSRYSIAVLPFVDMTEGQEFGYFADGLSEELINVLTRAEGLRVISRTSSFAFRSPDVDMAEIREKLDITHLLEGSVRLSGDTLRITAQLINTSSQDHVWSETYNRQLADSLDIQDDIATEVLERLTGSLRLPLRAVETDNPVAHRMYLHGKYLVDTTDPQHEDKAESLLRQAATLDPGFAPAWRELARLQWRRIGKGPDIVADIAAAQTLLQRALSADPNDAGTLAYLGWHNADFSGDLETAARLFERAVAVDAAHEDVVRTASLFASVIDYPDIARALVEFGVDRNPLCAPCAYALTHNYLRGEDATKAEAAIREFQRVYGGAHTTLGLALLLLERPSEALESFGMEQQAAYRLAGQAAALHDLDRHEESAQAMAALMTDQHEWADWLAAEVFAWRGQTDDAFAAIDRAVAGSQITLGGEIIRKNLIQIGLQLRSPWFSGLRQHPRWNDLLERLGLAPEALSQLDLSYEIPGRAARMR